MFVKAEHYPLMFFAPIKDRSRCFIALRVVRAHGNVEHSQRRENVIYRDRSRVVEYLLQLENKQQIMQSKCKNSSRS